MNNAFARLEELSTKINATSDSISESLKQVEAKLASLRLGVEVWLEEPIDVEPVESDIVKSYLGYAKVQGTWRLAYITDSGCVVQGDPSLDVPIPLQQCTREIRVSALKRIPDLLGAVEKKAQDELQQIQSALDTISSISSPTAHSATRSKMGGALSQLTPSTGKATPKD